MQYVDDTLLFLDSRINSSNLKWISSCFEHLSGMRINFHILDLVPINVGEDEAHMLLKI
jgi:hypothetical protein